MKYYYCKSTETHGGVVGIMPDKNWRFFNSVEEYLDAFKRERR